MSKYLEPGDEGAWEDFPSKPEKPSHMGDAFVECPRCQGHGGWNLSLRAYPLHDMADTAENRHRYSHFRSHCGQCHGYGWTDDVECIHEMEYSQNVGNCENEYKCKKCDHRVVYDSSG